jgi:GR25 family glycosyltransferase involved in LPS biosynthesis
MSFAGRYINMDSSPGRRAALEARLAAVGQAGRYQRFAAVDGRAMNHPGARIRAGELGCMASHLGCVAEAAARDIPTHIIEDDVVFTPGTVPILNQVLDTAFAAWDVLFCDIVVPMHASTLYGLLDLYRKTGIDPHAPPGAAMPTVIHYLPLEGVPFTGAASYLISPAGARKLEPLIAAHIERGPTMPVDNLYQVLCAEGRVRAACAVPFLTSVDPDDLLASTLGRDQDALSVLAFFLLRQQFFIGRDPSRARVLADRLSAALAGGEDMKVFMTALHFILSDQFKQL